MEVKEVIRRDINAGEVISQFLTFLAVPIACLALDISPSWKF